ncbi:hypothetical protein SAMN06296241_1346 [Salinimicrobium sediminis]|uniref:Uncharacterized protein n=1 Tax=Salinimicrobium sediminis TaxID=1343891 RepID=A0A285X5X3_9FLAO|nr:hypothetical protein [Salinimicrobium sediminis]SOC79809.1 hypothetical protein SAMN06296241_1346 [Salinimicrobium sediminis]
MSDHGIYKDGHFMIVCGSKEKAIEMLENYPGGEVYPVEQVNGKWVKKE